MFGATKQNLLKLFGLLVEGNLPNIPSIPVVNEIKELIIY